MNAGDVVLVDFPGVTGVKTRPAIVVVKEVKDDGTDDC